jgi:hypothetical protein
MPFACENCRDETIGIKARTVSTAAAIDNEINDKLRTQLAFLHQKVGVLFRVMTRGFFMKKLALATAAILALLSIAGCANVGKGKAPPPVVTKG